MAVKNGGCDGSQVNSANGVCNAHTIRIDKAAIIEVAESFPCQGSVMNLTAVMCMPTPSNQAPL